jgi:outer membrane protein assembly factor BamD
MRPIFFVLVILALFLGGCHDIKLQEEKSATELMDDGLEKFEDRDYRSAISAYRRVTDWYPFSEHVATAKLQIAEAYFKLRQYSQAAASYEEYSNLYPTYSSTPYALYQVGRCFFDQVYSIDRDQDNARQARAAFNRFLKRYPDSEYADPARAHVKECQRYIAANELLVAKYYYKSKNYKAALDRFLGIVANYPDTGVQHVALQYIAKCEALLAALAPVGENRTSDAE